MHQKTDFVVIGSGIAGLNSALTLAAYGQVIVVTKAAITDGSTNFAQGGIAAVTDKKDTVLSHVQDTMQAGVFHNNKTSVRFLVNHGKEAIEKLEQAGVLFDKKQDGTFSSTLEAAHTFPRILHATDFTGQAIEKALVQKATTHPNITVWDNTYALDLIVKNNKCFGVTVIKNKKVISLFSRGTILATGGAGQLYEWTTNPHVSTSDGIAMAKRAGAKLLDLEFYQFHPTALLGNTSPLFLLSEALRGEGALLIDKHGDRFMKKVHKNAELAPRDVVARAIFHKQREGTVYLDIRHKGKAFLVIRFPNLFAGLKKRGLDMSTDLIPVTPAAHFLCGGIKTDIFGKTSVKNLFAYGEVAATGVHGANRLASNSLLEGIVFSSQIAACIPKMPKTAQIIKTTEIKYSSMSLKNNFKKQVQQIMWEYVGIERTSKGLMTALTKLKVLEEQLKKINECNEEIIEAKNMVKVATLIAAAAKKRKKSLGTHYITT